MIGKEKIKFISSLKEKKYRQINNCYVAEGPKIVLDTLKNNPDLVKQIYATSGWLKKNSAGIPPKTFIVESEMAEIKKISSFKTVPEVIAVLHIEQHVLNIEELAMEISLVLDTVQDPGNLGNIIRIADWFGIRHIVCSPDCADCYNPKVVQASMGAITRVKVHYADLGILLRNMLEIQNYKIYGTFPEGDSIYETVLAKQGAIVLGNESKGISNFILPYIKTKLCIPSFGRRTETVESLNVAAAAAIVCSEFRHRAL
ncbi:MAG: RNA methyltransferase [Bacteroidales bacterium]|nr:RNA methyltransferase [Bacteroidales bacterium]